MAGEPRLGHRGGALVRRATDTDVGRYTAPAALLVGLVVLVVPALAVSTDVPPRRLFLAASAAYLLAILAADTVFEGLAAALFVTAAFNVTAYLTGSQAAIGFRVRILDVLLVAVLASLAATRRWRRVSPRSPGGLVVWSFAAFVVWSFAASVVQHGLPGPGRRLYAVDQLRYLGLLVASALIVGESDPRCAVYPLLLSLGGALAFAVDEVFTGRAGYLTHFGTVGDGLHRLWPSPSLTSFPLESTVLYAGSPVGQSRLMAGMALLFLALLFAAATRSRTHRALAAAGPLGVVGVLASSSDAGRMGLYAVAAIFLAYWSYLGLRRYGARRLQRAVVPLFALAGAAVLVWALTATAAGRSEVLFLKTNTLDVRLGQYAAAVRIAARDPLFGLGRGFGVRPVVHNVFLANLVATGVVGLAAYAASVAATVRLAVDGLADAPPREGWVWLGALAGAVAFYVYAFWVVAHLWVALNATYWLVAGVAVGTSLGSTDGSPGATRDGPG